ncbi:helix-turn-helix transcriptional regulator [Ligilactobacillus ruminis]|nr:helix-turn-helix transcriptional regulator [Ligilactobacillus ruminis]
MFPERMRALRKGCGLTLGQLADALNEMDVSYNQKKNTRSQLSKWECGVNTPTYLDIRQLAEFFDVSTDYLCGRAIKKVDLVETLASSADVCFGAQKLDTKEKGELYELIKGFLKGRKERGLRGSAEENGDMQLKLENFDEEDNRC